MIHLIEVFLDLADAIARVLLRATMVLLVVLIGTTVYEVVARYGFSAPTMWAFDTSYMINGALFLVASGYTLHVRGHVRIDVLSARLPIRVQMLLDALFYGLLFVPTMFILTRAAIGEAWHAFVTDDRVLESAWMPLIWPFYAALAIGVATLGLQAAANFIRAVRGLLTSGVGADEQGSGTAE